MSAKKLKETEEKWVRWEGRGLSQAGAGAPALGVFSGAPGVGVGGFG